MTDDMLTLGKRATACKGWRWMAGMKIAGGIRVTESLVPFTFPVDVPDLSDPATMGCFVALVREAWNAPKAQSMWTLDGRCCVAYHPLRAQEFIPASSEAEAWVAALENAP